MPFRSLIVAVASLTITASPAFAEHHSAHDKTMSSENADIVDTAVAAGSFTTLVAAIQAAGLETTLRGDGPYTVFAPTDEAFAKLPASALQSLLKPENKDKLVQVLTYHVVSGKTKSQDIAGKTLSVATVNGAKIAIDGKDGVTVNEATVSKADIWTSNGVIHVIDTVLLPPSM